MSETLYDDGDVVLRFALLQIEEMFSFFVSGKWRRLKSGVLNIPVPEDGVKVVPDVVIIPVVGFGWKKYPLGYGGGYF